MKRVRVNARNHKRYEANWKRAFGSDERVAFVKGLHCVARHSCQGEIENAHIVSGGIGRRSDAANIVPLCAHHHRELHANGRDWFERYYVLDLREHADGTEGLWQEVVGGRR